MHVCPGTDFVTFPFLLLQNEDFTVEKIRFGVEGVYIDSWMRRRIYDAFKEILESGVRHHLQVSKKSDLLTFNRVVQVLVCRADHSSRLM